MRSSEKVTADFGNKLLPRIIRSVVQGVIATKTGLTEHEMNVRIGSGQALIDKAGHEAAELLNPYIQEILKHHGDSLHPILKDYFGSIASGEDQIKALSGLLAGGIQSSLSSVISNYGSAAAYPLNEAAPNLVNDPPSQAQGVAAGLIGYNQAARSASYVGLKEEEFHWMTELARTIPGISDLDTMLHRGLINSNDYQAWVQRAGYPAIFQQYFEEISTNILTVADAALAVTKGILTETEGRSVSRRNGYSDDDWQTVLGNTGEPPGAAELQEAYRRGFVDKARFEKGIRQSRVRNEWIDTLLALRYAPLNTADAVNAHVEGYLDEAQVKSIADQNGLEPGQYKTLIEAAGDPLAPQEMMRLWREDKATQKDVEDALRRGRLKDNYIPFALKLKYVPMSVADAIEARVQGYLTEAESKKIALENGLREEDYAPLYDTAGSPLPKEEMLRLYNRGEVTLEQVKQALRESRLKDKYIDTALHLRVTLPGLFELRALLANGSLTPAQGTKILLEEGYQTEIVKAIVDGAVGTKTAASKQLTLGMYSNLYEEGAITSAEFLDELGILGYAQHSAELILAEIDLKLTIAARNQAIAKVRVGYTTGKIGESAAQSDLNALEIPAETVDRLLHDWDIVKSLDIKTLSPAQVVDAWFMNLWNPADKADNLTQALTYLTSLGYDGPDSVKLLEIKNKGPLNG